MARKAPAGSKLCTWRVDNRIAPVATTVLIEKQPNLPC